MTAEWLAQTVRPLLRDERKFDTLCAYFASVPATVDLNETQRLEKIETALRRLVFVGVSSAHITALAHEVLQRMNEQVQTRVYAHTTVVRAPLPTEGDESDSDEEAAPEKPDIGVTVLEGDVLECVQDNLWSELPLDIGMDFHSFKELSDVVIDPSGRPLWRAGNICRLPMPNLTNQSNLAIIVRVSKDRQHLMVFGTHNKKAQLVNTSEVHTVGDQYVPPAHLRELRYAFEQLESI